MAEQKRPRDKESAITPPRMAETTPPQYPSGDFSYTLEAVMGMQKALGELTEAVNGLKEQSKEHGRELRVATQDIHTAKVLGKTLLWAVGIVGALLGIFLTAYLKKLFSGSA